MKQRIYHTFKHWRLLLPLAVFTISFLTYCGGGGGGGGGMPTAPPAIVTGFIKAVELPAAGQGDWTGLFRPNASGARYQALVRAQDLTGSGRISSISFRFGADSTGNSCPNVTIKLGHTSVSALSTTFASNVEQGRGSLVTVYGPATLSIPAGATDSYFSISLSGDFHYNGVDNLVVDVTAGTCSAATTLKARAATASYTALIYAPNSAITGNTWDALAHMKFSFAGGGDAIVYPTFGGTGDPFDTGGEKVQLLYSAVEVNGSGRITGIAFPVYTTTTAETYTVTIKLGHSTLTEFPVPPVDFSANYSEPPVTVANAASFLVPAGVPANAYVWLPMPDNTFIYNGVNSLIVEIDVTTASGTTYWTEGAGALNTLLRGPSGSNTATLRTNGAYDIKFRFLGSTMDVNTPNGMSGGLGIAFPFYNTSGKIQYLYRAAELGTKGAISKIACRAAADSPAESGFNYTVVMGHTTATVLDTTFAANLASPVMVFSGTLSIPAALKGDWIEIPLSTPFSYNGRDNLVVQFAGTGGVAGGALCVLDGTSATLYASREVSAPSSTATTGGYNNRLIDMRFTLQ